MLREKKYKRSRIATFEVDWYKWQAIERQDINPYDLLREAFNKAGDEARRKEIQQAEFLIDYFLVADDVQKGLVAGIFEDQVAIRRAQGEIEKAVHIEMLADRAINDPEIRMGLVKDYIEKTLRPDLEKARADHTYEIKWLFVAQEVLKWVKEEDRATTTTAKPRSSASA